jgi:hypothetical protein
MYMLVYYCYRCGDALTDFLDAMRVLFLSFAYLPLQNIVSTMVLVV